MKNIYVTDWGKAREIVEGDVRVHIDGLISVNSHKGGMLDDQFTPSLGISCYDCARDWQTKTAPSEEQVRLAIIFAREIEGTILIHCAAGVSRSTGIALAIFADNTRDPVEALWALDTAIRNTHTLGLRQFPDDHAPNKRMVLHTDNIFEFKGKLIELYSEQFQVRDFHRSVGLEFDEWIDGGSG